MLAGIDEERDDPAGGRHGLFGEGWHQTAATLEIAVNVPDPEWSVERNHQLVRLGRVFTDAGSFRHVDGTVAEDGYARAEHLRDRIVQAAGTGTAQAERMHVTSVLGWLVAVAGLLLKYVAVTTVQGRRRFQLRAFRWHEDAAAFGGHPSSGREDDVIERCQAVLRNDAESQPFFLAFSAAWVALGASCTHVSALCGGYVLTRWAHAYFLVRPRQPMRNRCFVLGQLALLAIACDAIRRAWTAAS